MGERARAQVLARRRTGRESHSGLLFSINSLPGLGGSIPHVGGEDNDVEVLVDVVNDLVSIVLGTNTIGHLGNQLFDNLELAPEEGIPGWVHDVIVCLEEGGVHSGHSLDKALEAGGDLELLEQAGGDAASGGAGEADLV